MIIGGYTVHLYCDNEKAKHRLRQLDGAYHMSVAGVEFDYEFAGRNEAQCLRQAKNTGWRISRDKIVICPVCSGYGIRFRHIRSNNNN